MRRRLTYGNVMATLALFVALGGSSYALSTVGSREIVNNSVRGKDVRNGTLTGTDLRDRSLSGTDVRDGALTGADLADDSLTGADVDETRLGRVPSADVASSAERAGDAGTLGGLAPAAFERSGRFMVGSGSLTATSAEVVLSVPELGVQLETDGDADQDPVIRVRNLTPGSFIDIRTEDTGGSGAMGSILIPATQSLDTMHLSRAGSSVGVVATCAYDLNSVRCFALRFGP